MLQLISTALIEVGLAVDAKRHLGVTFSHVESFF